MFIPQNGEILVKVVNNIFTRFSWDKLYRFAYLIWNFDVTNMSFY